MASRFDQFRDLPTRADRVIIVLDKLTEDCEVGRDESRLQSLIYNLQKNDPVSWEGFVFERRRISVRSDELRSILADLQGAEALTTEVPSGNYIWTDRVRRAQTVARAESRLSQRDVDHIRSVVQDLA